MRKPLSFLLLVCLLLTSTPSATASSPGGMNSDAQSAAPSTSAPASEGETPADYKPYIEKPGSRSFSLDAPKELDTLYNNIDAETSQPTGPYRTTVKIRGVADLKRLQSMKVPILAATKDTATILANRLQVEQLAKASFFPQGTTHVSHLITNGKAKLSNTATAAEVLASTAPDTDGDGLKDDEEGYWCTEDKVADSDNDKVTDGKETHDLIDWVHHEPGHLTRPSSGKPFAGWPPNHTDPLHPCFDSDYDSVPDAVEVYVFGLNPNRESTPRDKFDDGQKLFGLTNCPGSGGGCGYGALPRQVDWDGGVIFAEMPSWVKAPYDSPFVASFPNPEVDVVPSSFRVTARTTIQTDRTITNGEEHTYGTSTTNGTSSGTTDTATWNNWEETSISIPQTSQGNTLDPALKLAAKKSRGKKAKSADNTITIKGAFNPISEIKQGIEDAYTMGTWIGEGINYLVYQGAMLHYSGHLDTSVDPVTWAANDMQTRAAYNRCNPTCPAEDTILADEDEIGYDEDTETETGNLVSGANPHRIQVGDDGQVRARSAVPMSFPVYQPVPVVTNSHGKEWGGSHATTHTEYEEHATSQADTTQFAESWTNATAQDTTHAADLNFTYRISNAGTDYAREIGGIAFNIYIGDDPNPIYTYFPAADVGGNGKFSNFMPGETHQYASRAVPLTLEQMKSVDLGAHIFVVVEDFSYGVDELFYQDAVNSGLTYSVDNGDGVLHHYVLPTWGIESVQDVAKRFFPVSEDLEGNLLSLRTPDYSTSPLGWSNHSLTNTSWWDIYLDNLGEHDVPFKDIPAVANSMVLIRMNSDLDRDGYSDRTERLLNTDSLDPRSHPYPQLIAATRSIRTGNNISVTMAFLNTGSYDASGVEALMYAPDPATTISDNTIGGSGRVRGGQQVVLGSRIYPVSLTNWQSEAQPHSAGSYTGSRDKVFAFKALNNGRIGSDRIDFEWSDGTVPTHTVTFDADYPAPLPRAIVDAEGLQIGFDTGLVRAGDTFTVAAELPRDTFTYTINPSNPVTPVVVVSYNDPQGSHKFITPVDVTNLPAGLGTDLRPYATQMLTQGVGVDILTGATFRPGVTNTVNIVANSPHPQPVSAGHLVVDFVDETGTVVREQVYTNTFQTGPTVLAVDFNSSKFSPPYQPDRDYSLIAFFTDAQGNIIDSHARLFSTFAADPQPFLNTAPTPAQGWNFGTVAQGAQLQRTISLVNTGLMPLNAVVTTSDPPTLTVSFPTTGTLSSATGIISIPPAGTRDVLATLDTTGISGTVAMSLTIRTNDPGHPVVTIPVKGTITSSAATAAAFEVPNRPWDNQVHVYGPDIQQSEPVDFAHKVVSDVASVEPCRVYDSNHAVFRGVGRYCTDLIPGSVSNLDIFGTGRDGPLNVPAGQTVYADDARASLIVAASAGQNTIRIARTKAMSMGAGSWMDTGVDVSAGQWFMIDTVGSGNYQWTGDRSKYKNPDGEGTADGSYIVPGVPQWSVVGRVGNSGGFFVGTHMEGTASSTGRLYLAFNDWTNGYNDNFGSYAINIMVQPDNLAVGDEILIAQMQGTGAGNYEANTIQNISNNGLFTLSGNLSNSYWPRPSGGGATLCEHPGYGGVCETFQEQTDDGFLHDNWINGDTASAIRLDGDFRAMLFQDFGQRLGQGYELFTQSVSDFGGHAIGHDTTSSISTRANQAAQVVKIPHYETVNVQGNLTAHAWDGWSGGIIAFKSREGITVGPSGKVDASGIGFNGGIGPTPGAVFGQQGEGRQINGRGFNITDENGGGGGGGAADVTGGPSGAGGGGGGYGSQGEAGHDSGDGRPGGSAGSTDGGEDLAEYFLGSGGGSGGADNSDGKSGDGGGGGGLILLYGLRIDVQGSVQANGATGQNATYTFAGGGGGGSGGTVRLTAVVADIGDDKVTATGGLGGTTPRGGGAGGNGGVGRVRIDAQAVDGTTTPTYHLGPKTFYIAERPDPSDPSRVRLYAPDPVTTGKVYLMEFGRRLTFSGSENKVTFARVISQGYAIASMDALITNVGTAGPTHLTIDVGNDGTPEFNDSRTITGPTAISVTGIFSGLNAYLGSHPATNGYTVVPIRVTIDRQADVILTNFALIPGIAVDLAVLPGIPNELRIVCPNPGCPASEGMVIKPTVIVHNLGAQEVSSAVVGYYIGNPKAGGRLIGNSYVESIGAGDAVTTSLDWNTSGFVGQQTLYAVLDPPNVIAEDNENNNVISQTLYIKTKPELRVASIGRNPNDRVAGEPMTITLVISNTGETTAGSSATRLEVRGERVDSIATSLATSGISPTGTKTLNTVYTPLLFGRHTMTITADFGKSVDEIVESNNVTTTTFFVGLSAQNIDAGAASDKAYNPDSGFGYLNGETFDFSQGAGTPAKTVRFDGSGALQYRFDGLQPGRFYHLDAIFYQEGDNFAQSILFDGIAAKTVPLTSGVVSRVSLLVPAVSYQGDMSTTITFERAGGPVAATRFQDKDSAAGPVFVSQVALMPVEYVYVDAGGADDLAYTGTRGYGYLGGNTFASSLGATNVSTATNTYRSAFSNTISYRFDNLKPGKKYLVDLIFYDGPSSTRRQSALVGNSVLPSCGNLLATNAQQVQCALNPTMYAGGSVSVTVRCDNCTGPRLNVIALEEDTPDIFVPPPPTPTRTATAIPTAQTPTPTRTATATRTSTPSGVPCQAVSWNNAVNVMANGNSLTRTSGSGWNAGASSNKAIQNGDGYVQVTLVSTSTALMFGLSNGDSNQNYPDIDFALYTYPANNRLLVYEQGVAKVSFAGYSVGDVLRVAVEGGKVKYYRNNTLLYTSLTNPTFPLLLDTALYTDGAQLSQALICGSQLVLGEAVSWNNAVNVMANGNSLTRTSGSGWNAGASSNKAIQNGDGFVQATVASTSTLLMFGLSNGDSNQNYQEIDFALYTHANSQRIIIYEDGVARTSFAGYSVGDVLRVAVEGGKVKYYRNNTLLYTSLTNPTFPLLLDTALYTDGAQLSQAFIAGNLAPVAQPVSWNNVVNVTANGNSLTRASGSGWNAGASSNKAIQNGDGYVQATVASTSTLLMFGLSNGDSNQSYQEIDFALYTHANSQRIIIYEDGIARTSFAGYSVGDVLRVAVEGGKVKYYRNNTLLYTSLSNPTFPLLLDSALYTNGAQLSDAMIQGASLGSSAARPQSGKPQGCKQSFTDVGETDYYYQAVEQLACWGAVSGYDDGSFRPHAAITRGQSAKIIVLANRWELIHPSLGRFSDVPLDHPFYGYIETAAEFGVVSGYADGTYRSEALVTRGQISKMVVLAQTWPLVEGESAQFNDVPANHPFYLYIETALQHGVISGYTGGTFRPDQSTTRGQVSKIIYLAHSQ